jgi:hypothetical protein
MTIFYLDYENGNDATTNTPLGWWSVAYTGGSGTPPAADTVVTGATSGATAKLTVVVAPSSGSWAGGDAAGTMYFYGKSGIFQAEQVDFTGGHFNIAGDFVYCAWKTITDGATSGRIASGDVIRIAKSPDQVSIGHADWTDGSKAVILETPQNLTIDNCEAAWTLVDASDVSRVTIDRKEGGSCTSITETSTPGTNKLKAYYATGDLILSDYQKISFWFKNEVAISANQWVLCLCSNDDGTGIVDSFQIPAIPSTTRWVPLALARVGGGNLGSLIKSVALYSGSVAPAASKYVRLDNIIACTENGLNLRSLISKNSAAKGGSEGFYAIQSIVGATVLLDNEPGTRADGGRGYSGATEHVTTYKRETIKTAMATANAAVQQLQKDGTAGALIEYQGGYNPASNARDGETFFDGLNGYGQGIRVYNRNWNAVRYLGMYRYDYGLYIGTAKNNVIDVSNLNNCRTNGAYVDSSFNNNIKISNVNNNGNVAVYLSGSNDNKGAILSASNNIGRGLLFGSSTNNKFSPVRTAGNSNASLRNDLGQNYIGRAVLMEDTKADGATASFNSQLFVQSDDGINHLIYTDGGTIKGQQGTRHTQSGIAWKFEPDSTRLSGYPLRLSVAKIAVVANKLVTVKAWMKKDHATNIACCLMCRGYQIAGVDTDQVATKADDTDWEELTITFTPSAAGVVEIEACAWYVAGVTAAYIDDLTISQA